MTWPFPRPFSQPSEGEKREIDQDQEKRKNKKKKKKNKKKKKEKTKKKGLDFSNKVEFGLALEDYQVLKVSPCFFKLILILPSFIIE